MQFLVLVCLNTENNGTNDHLVRDEPNAVPVNIGGQVVLGQNKLFHRVNPIRVDHQLFFVLVSNENQGSMQLVNVENTILNAAKIAVAEKVILFVGIQRAGHNGPERRLPVSLAEQFNDLIASDLAQDFDNFFVLLNDPCRDDFVDSFLLLAFRNLRRVRVPHEGVFGNMAERTVPKIMQKGRVLHHLDFFLETESFRHQARYVGHSQCVVETGVECSGIDQIRKCQLPDSSKPLECLRTHHLHLHFIQADKVVDRISHPDRHSCSP